MAESSSTFTRASAGYERVMVPAVFAVWAKDLVETAALAPGMQVLDVACGTGIVARLASAQVGSTGHVVGLDANEPMLAVARAQPAPIGAQIEWRQGDATNLPFPDEQFDRALCQHGLQYVTDRAAALREMRRAWRGTDNWLLAPSAEASATKSLSILRHGLSERKQRPL